MLASGFAFGRSFDGSAKAMAPESCWWTPHLITFQHYSFYCFVFNRNDYRGSLLRPHVWKAVSALRFGKASRRFKWDHDGWRAGRKDIENEVIMHCPLWCPGPWRLKGGVHDLLTFNSRCSQGVFKGSARLVAFQRPDFVFRSFPHLYRMF